MSSTHTPKKAPPGYTYALCPGCKQARVEQPRLKDGVCYVCRTALNQFSTFARESAERELVRVGVPTKSHLLPHIPHAGGELRSLLHALMYVCSTPSTGNEPNHDGNDSRLVKEDRTSSVAGNWWPYDMDEYRAMDRRTAEVISELYAATTVALGAAYKAGREDGSNLLAMLSAGELTNKEFERRAGIATSFVHRQT